MTLDEAMAETVTVKETVPPVQREWVHRTYTYDALLEDFDGEYDLVGTLIKKNRVLAAEVRRRDAMVCETCRHRFLHYCEKTRVGFTQLDAEIFTGCEDLGNGCLAWEKKDV